MIKCIIVDDETRSREVLRELIQLYFPHIEITALAQGTAQAREAIARHNPDLVFLDIRMPDEDGLAFLKSLNEKQFEVIFTTAFSEYAIQAFRHDAVDYLLKPIKVEDIKSAVSKAERKLMRTSAQFFNELQIQRIRENRGNSKLALPSTDGLRFIKITDILYMQASGNYTEIFASGGRKFIVSRTLGEYEKVLGSLDFFRIHHSTLVNLTHVQHYMRGEGGYVVMTDQKRLDVSRRKKEDFLQVINGKR